MNQERKAIKLLVCMTTVSERMVSDFFPRVLNALLAQQLSCEFHIVLFVPHASVRTGEPYPDPAFLHKAFDPQRLTIWRCADMGPATKFAGLLGFLPHLHAEFTHVYIADDDIILKDHALQRMLGRLIERSQVHDERRLVLANDARYLNGLVTVAGYAGIVLPMDFFWCLARDVSLAPLWNALASGQHPCFNVDDVLLSRLLQRYHFIVEGTGQNPFTEIMNRAQTDEHPAWFELCKHTDRKADNLRCLCAPLP